MKSDTVEDLWVEDEIPKLHDVLASMRADAHALRAHGHAAQAGSLEDAAERVALSMRSYLTILSEKAAMLRSGWSSARLRNHFPEWERLGFAQLDGHGLRTYRECIVPPRGDAAADRLAGVRGEGLRKAGRD